MLQMLLTKKIQINEDFHYLTMKSAYFIYTLCSYVGIIFYFPPLFLSIARVRRQNEEEK